MMRLIRWILMIPAAVVAWYAALSLGLVILMGVDALCPAEQVISGLCVAPWYEAASGSVICMGAALAAVLIMLACTWLAPSYKPQVAIATFVVGAAVASLMGWSAGAFGPMVAAIIAGALALWILTRRLAAARDVVHSAT
jgi:hypothetical protein